MFLRSGPISPGRTARRGIRMAAAGLLAATALGCAPAGMPPAASDPPARRVEVDLSRHFEAFGAEGAFVLYDAGADRLVVHNPEQARSRFLPASTFKILNSLIALEEGVVADEHAVIPWDSVVRSRTELNRDLDLTTAFRLSAVPHYQEIARRIGPERMRGWLERVGYGNADIDGGIDRFWLTGELRISPEEQVALLRRLHAGDLPFSERSQEIVRRIMRIEEGDGYVLRGKTGWAVHEGVNYGWLVGWVEKEGNTHFFATQFESAQEDLPVRRAQQEITRGALAELGVLP